MLVRYGALEIAKLSINCITIFLGRLLVCEKVHQKNMLHAYLSHSIQINMKLRMTGFWLSVVNGKESKLSNLLYTKMLKDQVKGVYDLKWIYYINDMTVFVSVGHPIMLTTISKSTTKTIIMVISIAFLDLYVQDFIIIKFSNIGPQIGTGR